MKPIQRTIALFGLLAATTAAFAQPPAGGRGGFMSMFPEPTMLTHEQATTMMAAAEAYTNEKDWAMSIRIVDHNNNPVLLSWLNEVNPITLHVTHAKTTTVVGSKMSSAEYGQKVAAGEIEEIEGAVTFGGGLPIFIDGEFVGAIAASGGTPDEDAEVAMAGIEAIGASASMD